MNKNHFSCSWCFCCHSYNEARKTFLHMNGFRYHQKHIHFWKKKKILNDFPGKRSRIQKGTKTMWKRSCKKQGVSTSECERQPVMFTCSPTVFIYTDHSTPYFLSQSLHSFLSQSLVLEDIFVYNQQELILGLH